MKDQQAKAALLKLNNMLSDCTLKYNKLTKEGGTAQEFIAIKLEISNLLAAIELIKLDTN